MSAPLTLALRRLLVSSPSRRVEVTFLASHEQRRALATSRGLASGSHIRTSFFSNAIVEARRSIAAAAASASPRDQQREQQREAPSFTVPDDAPDKILGQVMSAQANFVRVRVDSVDAESTTSSSSPSTSTASTFPRPELLCTVRALLKKMRQSVLVGDRVAVSGIDWASARGAVDSVILPRSSVLADPPVANADHVLLVLAAASPPLEPRNASKFLVAAEAAGLPVSVALNKADLVSEEELKESVEMLRSWGYEVFPTTARERGSSPSSSSSSSSSSFAGVSSLLPALHGRVTVLAGPSGVGKSSLINALLQREKKKKERKEEGEEEEERCCDESAGDEGDQASTSSPSSSSSSSSSSLLAVGEVSRAGRGRHTTRHVCLVPLPMSPSNEGGDGGGEGGARGSSVAAAAAAAPALLADTPGFNQPDLASSGVRPAELASLFPEVRYRIGRCAFADCAHVSEPGCALRDGVDSENEEDEENGSGNNDDDGNAPSSKKPSSPSSSSSPRLWKRHPWYVETLVELREAFSSAKARQAEKAARQGAVRMKSSKRGGGGGGGVGGERTGVSSSSSPSMRAEALLNPKKDRRVSRRSRKKGLADLLEEEGL